MRWGLVVCAIGVATPLHAQQWEPQVGIAAGFMHQTVNGQDLSAWDLPGTGLAGLGFPLPSSVYGIIPVRGRWAVEIGAGVNDLSPGGGQFSTLTLAPRLDAALTPRLYAALGPTMTAVRLGGLSLTQWGAAGAVGYRARLTRHLTARVEAYYEHRFSADSNNAPKADLYGVQLGFAAVLGQAAPPPRSVRGAAPANAGFWAPAIVFGAGYVNAFVPGQGSVSFFSVPGSGSAPSTGFSTLIPGPAGVSAVIPVSRRIAIEPAADVHSFAPSGGSTFTVYEVTARADYAFNRHLYAAIGVGASGTSSSAPSTSEWAGLAAVGVRFPLVAGIGARLEYDYATWNGDGNNAPALQTNALMFGMIAPIR
jgi:hypothetical protein